jgi:hypothetical protein
VEAELPLRDYHLPSPVSWWPPAPGWWALAVLVLLALAAAIYLWKRWRRPTVRKLALAELTMLESAPLPPIEKVRQLSTLLRRVGLSTAGRAQVAGLAGQAWLQWLDQPLAEPQFSRGPGRLLLDAPYRPHLDGELDELFRLCRDWLNRLPDKVLEPAGGVE